MRTSPLISTLYTRHAMDLARYVQARFPHLCAGKVEDVVSDTFIVACSDPELIERAWRGGGEAQARGLLKVIAWRLARAQSCRGAGAREVGHPDAVEHAEGRAGAQEIAAEVRAHLAEAISASALAVCPCVAERLAEALADRLVSGESDAEVARRHALPREYINRARRDLASRFGQAAS